MPTAAIGSGYPPCSPSPADISAAPRRRRLSLDQSRSRLMQQVNDLVHWHGIKCQNGPPSAAAILGEARGCLSTASFHAYPKRLERRAKLSGWLFSRLPFGRAKESPPASGAKYRSNPPCPLRVHPNSSLPGMMPPLPHPRVIHDGYNHQGQGRGYQHAEYQRNGQTAEDGVVEDEEGAEHGG
jgi:hypothetical protein